MAHILLMEDDTDQAHLMAALIEREGHSVRIAPDADTAMQLIDEEAFDLVVTDLFVKRRAVLVSNGGLRLIGFIRNGERKGAARTRRAVPIIAVSGVLGGPSDMHFLKIAEQIGANARLEKPVQPSLLFKTIENLLPAPRV